MKKNLAAAVLATALFVAGCESSGDIGPTDPTSGNGNPAGGTPLQPPAATAALFQPLQGVLPFPTDLYFSGSTDGTLNIQPANALIPSQTALNALDGFSTTAVIRARFASALDPASLTAASVRVIQVTIDNSTKATTGVVRPLVFGDDFTAGLGPEPGVGNTILEIRPTRPLVPSTGTTNNGYLVLLTNGITTATGEPTTPDEDYAAIKAALPTCSSIANATMQGICLLTGAHLQIAQAVGVDPASVVLSFSFSTQSIHDTMDALAAVTGPRPIAAQNTGLTTAQAVPGLRGNANIHVGTLEIPYYLSRTEPLTGFWQGNPSPLDANSRFLTRFNPLPVATETLQIPVLVTVPNAASALGGVKPAGGWPVLIFQHGITRNRTDMLGVAEAFADAGFVVVAIDQPLHGITDPTNPLYAANPAAPTGSIERTFDLDLVDNQTGTPGPDGVRDPSGTHFINLASLLTSRDNLRQAAADLMTLARSLPNLNLDTDPGGDIDPTRIHFLGHSLGGIVGTVWLGTVSGDEVRTATLAMAGGGVAQLLRDSPSFGPRIIAGLQAQGLQPGTTLFEQFFRDAQTVVDAGDPVNFIASAASARPIHLLQVIGDGASSPPDQVVPNSATQRLVDAAGLTRIAAPAAPGPVVETNGSPPGHRVYVNFTAGGHGSILDPSASLETTVEMQTQAVSFAAGSPPMLASGTVIVVGNPTVIQP
nr:lipolytic protein [uncultured bacterium]